MKEKEPVDHYLVIGPESKALVQLTPHHVDAVVSADNIEAAQETIEDIANQTGATNLTATSLKPEEPQGRTTFGFSDAWRPSDKSSVWEPNGPKPNYVVSPQKPGHA